MFAVLQRQKRIALQTGDLKMNIYRMALRAAFFLPAIAPFVAAGADAFPTQPIRMIVPYAPGGASDVLARRLAIATEHTIGQPIIVDNRAGGATVAGTSAVASAQANGYTLGLIDSAFLINPALLGSKLPYDTEKDFRAVNLVATAPVVLAVNKDVGASTLAQLIALAKAKPGQFNFSSAGNGTALHLAGEQFKLATGTDMVHVPYKGGAPSVMAVVSGETQITFSAPSTVLPHIQSGRLRALAVTGSRRLASLPNVPTFTELGFAKVDATISFGIVAPKAVPDAVVDKLARAFNAQLASGPVRQQITELGFEAASGSSADYAKFITREIASWKKVVREANVHVDF
jgi:tripartite-type tricarboxylate transporter receptor subunit TctC